MGAGIHRGRNVRLGSLGVVPGTRASLVPPLQSISHSSSSFLSSPALPNPRTEAFSCLFGIESSAGFCPEQRDLLPMSQGLGHSSVTKAVTSRQFPVTA